MKKWTETDQEKRLAYIQESAWQHASEQMKIDEMHLHRHPGGNEEYDSSLASLNEIETEMEKKLDYRFADDCRWAYMNYAGSIAMEVYMRGVMDGARLHYAIMSRELPYQLDEQNSLCAACIPFDKMTQVGWNFEDVNPLYLSHLLSPYILRNHLMKLCTESSYIKGFQPQWGKEIPPSFVSKARW